MKVRKVTECYCMNDCNHDGEGFVISYNDDTALVYLCENHLNELTKALNDLTADRWLEDEMEY